LQVAVLAAVAHLQRQPAQVERAAFPAVAVAAVEPRLTQAQPAQAVQEGAALSS